MSHLVEAPTIGRAWLEIAAHIMAQGSPATYDGRPILEVAQVTLEVAHPDPDDELIARNADPERLAWMLSMASFAVVATEGSAVLGFAIGFDPGTGYDSENYRWWSDRADDFVYLDRIVVAEEARGRRVGSALYDRLEGQARARGAVVAEVNVDPPNEPSLAFHAGRGYVEHGRRGEPGQVVSMVRLDL